MFWDRENPRRADLGKPPRRTAFARPSVAIGFAWILIHIAAAQAQTCPSSPSQGSSCTVGGVEFVAIPDGTFAMGESSDTGSWAENPYTRSRSMRSGWRGRN